MKPRVLGVVLLLLLCQSFLNAAYLKNIPYQITQPNGQVVSCLMSGDEFYRRIHDQNNFTILRNESTGYYSYAVMEQGEPVASDYYVGQVLPAALGIPSGIGITREHYQRIRQQFLAPLSRTEYRAPTIGTINNLVIFIRFSDDTEFGQTISTYSSMFNEQTAGANSMYNFYREASYGQLSITTGFYPTSNNGMVVSYQDSHPRSYYEPYSTFNTSGYDGDDQRTTREHTLLANAAEYCSSQIPETLNLDGDGDNQVDNICFTIKGGAGDWADLLWPHMWVLETMNVQIHGKRVYTYNFQLSEFLQDSGVGVLCHEMFHSLGSPDLYHYSYDGMSPVGNWDLMEGTQNPPQHMGAYMKHRYGNWIDEIPTITATGTYTLHPLTSAVNNCYKIPSPNSPTQYFVVEYRSATGTFESSVPGSGLVIYRIDGSLDGEGNASGPPDEVYIYRRNGTSTNNGQVNQAFYSSASGRTSINDGTNPSSFLQDGSAGGLNISQISAADSTIHFYVNLSIPPVYFDEGFETGNFSAFTWEQYGNNAWQVQMGNAYAGLYSAKSGTIGNNQTSGMQLVWEVPQTGDVGFYKKVSSESANDYLIFSIDGIEQGRWSGEVAWSYSSFTVTAGVHVFSWLYDKDNGLASGSDAAWVDNISFPQVPLLAPTNLTGQFLEGHHVHLSWTPVARDFVGYTIYKNGGIWDVVSAGDPTEYTDLTEVTTATTYKVTALYTSGESAFSNEVLMDPSTLNDDTPGLPEHSGIAGIYPNPFRPGTTIAIQVKVPGVVTVQIFNLKGEKIRTLQTGSMKSGSHLLSWDGTNDQHVPIASGIYLVRMDAGSEHYLQKMVRVK